MGFAELKYEFIRTPLEGPLVAARRAVDHFTRRRQHPELDGLYEQEERMSAVLRRIVGRRSNCIDIGCHYGSVLSTLCALAPEGRHVAFEPTPHKACFLRRKFPEVDLHETALADRADLVAFHVNRTRSGFSGLARHGDGEFEEIVVSCVRLDDVVPRNRRFDFVKIDVEGAELAAFRGATEFLARDRPVVLFECGPSGPAAFGYTPGDLHEFLTDACNYSIFMFDEYLRSGPPIARADFEQALVYPFRAFNWLAIPNTPRSAAAPS